MKRLHYTNDKVFALVRNRFPCFAFHFPFLKLDLINVVNIILGRSPLFRRAVAVQRVHAAKSNKVSSVVDLRALKYRDKRKRSILPVGTLGRHANGLSARVGGLEEVAQLLFKNVQALRARCVCHAEDGAPEVEGVCHVSADAHEDQEDEVEGVA